MVTPEEENPGEEMAELEAELDREISDAERMIDAISQPDPVLASFLGPDAEPKALDDFADEDFGEGDAECEEWTSPDSRWPIENKLEELEHRLLMLENPDPEPEIIPEQEPWRWAILTADWSAASNTVTANPCQEGGGSPDTETSLTLYCTLPMGGAPNFVALSDGDVVAYLPFYDSANEEYRGVIVGTPHAGTAATPAAILPTAFENETAQTDTWSRASPPEGKDGLTVRLQTRTAYVHDGDEKLYGFCRTFTYDSSGKLMTISAETRVEVDVPEACP